MNRAKKRLFGVLMVVAVLGGSCSRRPDEDRASASDRSRSAEVNSISAQHRDESSRRAAGSPALAKIATDRDANRQDTNVGGTPARFWGSELDINSGDLHGLLDYSDGHERYGDYESRLSKEVRRLGIPIPQQRNWQPLSAIRGFGGVQVKLVYPDVFAAAYWLLDLMDEAYALDRDRRSILQRFMMNMRTEGPRCVAEKAHLLIVEFADQHGLQGPFVPEYAEHLRQLRPREVSAVKPK